MRQWTMIKILSFCLIFSFSCFATHGNQTHRQDFASGVRDVFVGKCQGCHDKNGLETFSPEGFPRPEFLEESLKRLLSKDAIQMPPLDATSLTAQQLKDLESWLREKIQVSQTEKDSCSVRRTIEDEVSDDRGKALLSQACLVCHGVLENPVGKNSKSAIKTAVGDVAKMPHTKFLEPDGSLAFTYLGDEGERGAEALTKNYTSLGRLMNQIAGYYMPPRQDIIPGVHPEIASNERKILNRYLKQKDTRRSCAMTRGFRLLDTKSGVPTPSSLTYSAASKNCQSRGGWIPTLAQLESFYKNNSALFKEETCYWTQTLTGIDGNPHTKISPSKKSQTGLVRSMGSDTDECYALCVQGPI